MKRSAVRSVRRWMAMAVLLASAVAAPAQMSGPIKDFRVPEFDESGRKKSEIFGESAEVLADGKVRITGLRIVLYAKDGVTVEGTVVASECIFDRKDKSAFSNTPVSLRRDAMTISGKGMRWNAEGQHLEILNDVKVELLGVKMWNKKEKP